MQTVGQLINQSIINKEEDMALTVECPFCKGVLPFRRDKRGGRYFRCGGCQTAFFFSGKSVIDRMEAGGTWSIRVESDLSDKKDQGSPGNPFDLFGL